MSERNAELPAVPGGLVRGGFLLQDQPLPVLLEPVRALALGQALEWATSYRTWLEDVLHTHGAILFRDFPFSGAADFEAVVEALEPRLLPYTEGQSQRARVRSTIYTSTEYPADQDITLHNELSYTADPPRHLFFYCDIAPTSGGETPIADCREIFRHLPAEIRDPFVQRQVRYVKNMHGGKGFGKSWQEHFETDERGRVEEYLRQAGVEYDWKADGSLWTSQVRPAAVLHPHLGETVWFNQADLWHYSNLGAKGEALRRMLGEEALPTNAYYGDGGVIRHEDLDAIRQLFWQSASVFSWQAGDLLMIDNWRVAHGRKAFSGDRRILVAMA